MTGKPMPDYQGVMVDAYAKWERRPFTADKRKPRADGRHLTTRMLAALALAGYVVTYDPNRHAAVKHPANRRATVVKRAKRHLPLPALRFEVPAPRKRRARA
jgi:hypothetical protein